jgi:hypothetical protein
MAQTTQKTRVTCQTASNERGADDIENTASSIFACWTVFKELLPGNALIKSVTVFFYFAITLNVTTIIL